MLILKQLQLSEAIKEREYFARYWNVLPHGIICTYAVSCGGMVISHTGSGQTTEKAAMLCGLSCVHRKNVVLFYLYVDRLRLRSLGFLEHQLEDAVCVSRVNVLRVNMIGQREFPAE